jgi:hypothetical protein
MGLEGGSRLSNQSFNYLKTRYEFTSALYQQGFNDEKIKG